MQCLDYTEKSIVVRGEETKSFTKELSSLGGKYNSRLKGGPGWIFPKKSEEKVLSFINTKEYSVKPTNSDYCSTLLLQISQGFKKMGLKERLTFLSQITNMACINELPNANIESTNDEYELSCEENEEDSLPRQRLLK